MFFQPDHIYHLYNRGNNKTRIFFEDRNYIYFLNKVRKEWLIYCDLLSYCLMPNHFHFLLKAKAEGCTRIKIKNELSHLQTFSKTIGKTLSSYTQAINKQNRTIGNLITRKTKAKEVAEFMPISKTYTNQDYIRNCFHYIHRNPLVANLVTDLRSWPYSSWLDYYDNRKGTLCNKDIALHAAGWSINDLDPSKEIIVDEEIIEKIW